MTVAGPETPESTAARLSGPAVYFDGTCSTRNAVVLEAGAAGLRITTPQHRLLDEWDYAELRRMASPEGVLRLGRSGETLLARLEVRDGALAAAIEERAAALDRGGAAERRLRRKVVLLSLAAVASLVATAIFGVPVLASRVLPLVPLSVERRLGAAVDREVRRTLDGRHLGSALTCGTAPGERPGRAALDTLTGKLEAAAFLPVRLRVDVVRRNEPNAAALPGGHIYVYEGLIATAQTPDELAGVLAHEIGHVAHRDGTRAVLQGAGLSFLFGMALGDFVGGGAVVIAAKTVLKSAYSRRAEAAADAYSVDLMQRAGGDPLALGVILARIVGDQGAAKDSAKYATKDATKERDRTFAMKLLLDHPQTRDRIAAIDAMAVTAPTVPLLDAAAWRALKGICSAAQAPAAAAR